MEYPIGESWNGWLLIEYADYGKQHHKQETGMNEWLTNPLFWILGMSVASALIGIGIWAGKVNEHKDQIRKDVDGIRKDADGIRKDTDEIRKDVDGIRKDTDGIRKDVDGIRKDVDEVRTDIKLILGRMSSVAVESHSPSRLTELGQSISEAIDASVWAQDVAGKLASRIEGMQPYDIQQMSYEYVHEEFKPETDMDTRMKQYAFENGLKYELVLDVLAIELRDKLLILHKPVKDLVT